jgi:hypothetical protein
MGDLPYFYFAALDGLINAGEYPTAIKRSQRLIFDGFSASPDLSE